MSTASAYLRISGIGVDVIFKDIKNLHIGVYPPSGRVRVAAPERLSEEDVRLAIVHRLPWIKKQRERLRDASRQSAREMVSGESHYAWGSRFRLVITEEEGRPQVRISGTKLHLLVPRDTDTEERRSLLDAWYRKQLKAAVPGLLAKWEPIVGKQVSGWMVRRMKTKWGSCNPTSGRISLNLELAKKHPSCLEYILVHEMAHLRERTHGERFVTLMDEYLPTWRALRDLLNQAPLAHQEWSS
ncbi:MAG: M48 family metallopeptidase [Actinobacteria bacterium]|nr:M48 family metallopeptidase [Actinomycetota bacterium]